MGAAPAAVAPSRAAAPGHGALPLRAGGSSRDAPGAAGGGGAAGAFPVPPAGGGGRGSAAEAPSAARRQALHGKALAGRSG